MDDSSIVSRRLCRPMPTAPTPFVAYSLPIGHRDWTQAPIAACIPDLPRIGIQKIYLLNTSLSNALIRLKEGLTTSVRLKDIEILNDVTGPADGVGMLNPGEACVLLAAGCTANVISTQRGIVVCHGSRESWIDREFVLQGKKSRQQTTVLHDAVDFLRTHYKIEPDRATFTTLFGIDPLDFPHSVHHPIHGEYNTKLVEYLSDRFNHNPIIKYDGENHLDISAVATGWAENLGFKDVASHCMLPRSGTSGFVIANSPEGREGRRNVVVVYVPPVK